MRGTVAGFLPALLSLLAGGSMLAGQQAQPVAVTIYNQDFAVARTSIDLDLHAGVNEVTATQVTSRLEPDSVILRDPTGRHAAHVAEQNYDAAVVNQDWLLGKYEGKTIDFEVSTPQGRQVVQGRIIRAGLVRQAETTFDQQQLAGYRSEPLIEVNGRMQFQLPGVPLFPVATDGLVLKPTLRWRIESQQAEHSRQSWRTSPEGWTGRRRKRGAEQRGRRER